MKKFLVVAFILVSLSGLFEIGVDEDGSRYIIIDDYIGSVVGYENTYMHATLGNYII